MEKLIELMTEFFEKLGTGDFAKNLGAANKNLNEAQKKQLAQKKLVEETTKKFKELDEQLKKGRKQYVDLGADLKRLQENIEDTTDPLKREKFEIERNILAQKFLNAQYKKSAGEFSKAFADVLVKGIGKGAKTLVTDLQDGSSGIKIASDLLTNSLDMNQAGLNAVSKTGSTLGAGLTAAGGKLGRFGIGLTAASAGLEYFSNAATDAAKFGIEVLSKEVEKTVKAFNDSTAAGALFGRGMDDLRKYSTQAGLTVDQFSNVIKNNSNDLARAGYTVTQAAKIVAGVTSRFAVQTGKSGQTLQREMMNLGLGFEEQANLTAQVISDLKRTGGRATTGEVASATVEIAKNMKAVADIMGEEYKARQDAAKKAAEQYAFQAKINEIARRTNDPGLPKRVEQAMSLMSESNRRAAVQALVLNGAVTDVAANLTGGADAGRDFANALLSGRTTMQDLTHGTAMLNDKFQQGTNEMGRAISRTTIATGDLADISQAYDQQQQDSFKANSGNINKAMQDAETLAGAQGKLQNAVMGAEAAAQQLRLDLQKTLTPAIEKFGVVANKILDGLIDKLNKAGIGPGHSFMEGLGHVLFKAGQYGLTGAGAGATVGAVAGGGVGAAPGAVIGGAGGVVTGTVKGIYDTITGEYDEGGVAQGPKSGYPAMLHGTEAVVPLPDGRNIPVNMDTSALTAAVHQQSGILNEMLRTMRDTNSLTSGILQHSM